MDPFTAYALDLAGEHEASARYHEWVHRALSGVGENIDDVVRKLRRGEDVDPLHMPPARFSLDGSFGHDDWPNFKSTVTAPGSGRSESIFASKVTACLRDSSTRSEEWRVMSPS